MTFFLYYSQSILVKQSNTIICTDRGFVRAHKSIVQSTLRHIWSIHSGREVRQYLNETFPRPLIAPKGQLERLTKSPDLIPIDLILVLSCTALECYTSYRVIRQNSSN